MLTKAEKLNLEVFLKSRKSSITIEEFETNPIFKDIANMTEAISKIEEVESKTKTKNKNV